MENNQNTEPLKGFETATAEEMKDFMANVVGDAGKIALKNQGGFVVYLDFLQMADSGSTARISGDRKAITLGFTRILDPDGYGIPDGAIITVYADVRLGRDNTAPVWVRYVKDHGSTAYFSISGTTFDNELGFTGLS